MRSHEWLNRNALRSFPIREDTSREATNTRWDLPDDLLVDAFVLSPSSDICLSSVCVTDRIVSVTIADSSTGQTLATASAVLGVTIPFSKVELRPVAAGTSGFVSFGDAIEPALFSSLPRGAHFFSPGARLETRCSMNTGPFPVLSIAAPGGRVAGSVAIAGNSDIQIAVSAGEDDGDPLSMVTISLADPSKYLSPCEEKTTPCDCPQQPISSINTVIPDADGRIRIDLYDEKGELIALGAHGLSFSILRDGDALCVKPAMPDSKGRLPADYDLDLDPITAYMPE